MIMIIVIITITVSLIPSLTDGSASLGKRRHHRKPEQRLRRGEQLPPDASVFLRWWWWLFWWWWWSWWWWLRWEWQWAMAGKRKTTTPKCVTKKLKRYFQKNLTNIFSENNTVVSAHKGSTTSLLCQVHKDSQHGVVRIFFFQEIKKRKKERNRQGN